ncbi:hypothetical protein DOTSEDRAFT_73396 [Dothistroma septosporum NZE10]|uniref:Uncharacterized protein n=1 Tax=Dothistroma septosporum (strain NZE10 / CBS 128990) TaxID=675120 RepID=N1PLV7_DOTSN|nr:hypothetical protein DOTSEDRAFT_73396 [Dothistroma septosporum NZE10]
MSTPHQHRGLPPPAAMALPDPRREGPPPSLTQSLTQPLGHMPQPPHEWRGQEESMRNWLAAKAEEDKRKQEEAKMRQEELRLEQRRIEQSMLRESLQGGVPPQMVPMIYAGIGGANLANVSLDWLNQYASQLQVAQQQIQQSSPDVRRDQGRLIGPPAHAAYPVAQPTQQQVLASQSLEQPQASGPLQTTFSAYLPASGRQQPTSAPRSATHTQLPRLTTNEMYIHQPPQAGAGSAHPLQQTQSIQQDQPASSPSIYFHHWVPPNETKGGNQPQTPASKGEPHLAHPSSQQKDNDYRESPRKRKAQDGHHPNPPPSVGPQYTSPSFSTTSSTSGRKSGHVRSRSNASAADSRPESRRDDPLPAPERSQPDSGRTQTSESSTRPPSRPKEELSGRSSTDVPRDFHPDPPTFRPGSS